MDRTLDAPPPPEVTMDSPPPDSKTPSPSLSSPTQMAEGDYGRDLLFRVQMLTEIGIALSAERNLNSLFERILLEARRFTHADAGTFYLLKEDGLLHFEVMHNDTFKVYHGGMSGNTIPLPPFTPSLHYVSGYAALTGKTVTIPDVYEAEGFDFTGTREYDAQTGYRSQSMLVVPMQNHEQTIVGVLQLINAKSPEGRVIPFDEELVPLAESLASQAGIALTNAELIHDLEEFIESLIRVMAEAVDEKDKTTAGHIARVTQLSVALAESVNSSEDESFVERRFTTDELNEIRIAGWLHDIGKITTPEWVINKGHKLEGIFDRADILRERFQAIHALRRVAGLEEKLKAMEASAAPETLAEIDRRTSDDLARIQEDMEFVLHCNIPAEFMDDEKAERLKEVAAKTYLSEDGVVRPYLHENELEHLSIRRGSISFPELEIMRHHVAVTINMLELVPFIKKLKNVPLYAGQHHEMLDGSGYPRKLRGEHLPIQSRILAICDIFDALSARDRPYKRPFTLEETVKILRGDASRGKLDSDLVELFVKDRVWERVGIKTSETSG